MNQTDHTRLLMRLAFSLGVQVLLHQPTVSNPSNTINSLFPTFASTAGIKEDWTGLSVWKTEVLQVKHEEFKSGSRGNYSLLYEISAFQKEDTASLWSILGLSFSLLLQSLWATLEEWGCNHCQTQNKDRKRISRFREVGKPVAQAVSLQELEKAAAFCSHLELNCHSKELSCAFIPKKNNYLYKAGRQIGNHIGNGFVDLLPLLSSCSKWKKIETQFSQQQQEEEVLGRAWASRSWDRKEQTLRSIPWSCVPSPSTCSWLQAHSPEGLALCLTKGTLLMSFLSVAFAAFGITITNVLREFSQHLIAQCLHWDSVRKTISSLF